LARQGSCDVYNTIPKSEEWILINCVSNAIGATLPTFYIFRGSRMKENHILFKQGKKMDDNIPFERIVIFFQHIYTRGDHFSRELPSFNPKWAWVTHHNKTILKSN